jgi:hypothetical protein
MSIMSLTWINLLNDLESTIVIAVLFTVRLLHN